MQFITDANIPKSLVNRLKSDGFDIVDIRDFLSADALDEEVYAEALRQKRTIISRDKHFGNILLYPLDEHYGIIVLRTKGLNSQLITEVLIGYLREIGDVNFMGTLYILENNKYRKRSR